MVNALAHYEQTLYLLDVTVVIKVIIRSAVLAVKLRLMTSTETATNLLKSCNNLAQSTSFSLLLPPAPPHLNNYQLNLGISSQSYNETLMESTQNCFNYATNWLTRTLTLLPSKSLNSKKQIKLHRQKVKLPSIRTKTTFLVVVFYSLSATTWSTKSYNPSKKQAWKFYLFRYQNHYGLRYITCTSPTTQLSSPTLMQTLSIHPIIP